MFKTFLFVVAFGSIFSCLAQSGGKMTKQTASILDSILSTHQITEISIRHQFYNNQVLTEQFVTSSSLFRLSGLYLVLKQEAGLLNKNPTREDYFPLDRVIKFITDEDRLIVYLEMPR